MAKYKRIRRRAPEWKRPVATERMYRSAILTMTDEYIREVKATLKGIDPGVRGDGILDDLVGWFNHLQAVATSLTNPLAGRLPIFFTRVARYNDRQWQNIIKVSTGFNFPASRDAAASPSPSGLGIDAYRAEPWLDDMQSAWVSNNTDLIKSIPVQMNDRIKQLVKNAVVNGESASSLTDKIQAEYGNARNRAELIAIDQIQKGNAALAEQRQRDTGVTSYIWRGTMDARERATHKAREGKTFEWDNPPPDGHPGQPVRCRCFAEPSFAGSIFDID